jgi:hypothetical protein
MLKFRFLLVFLLLMPVVCFAQFDSGAILGTIVDDHSAALSGVRITLEDIHRGTTTKTTTDNEGTFQFPSTPIGIYRIRTERAGFGIQTSQAFQLTIGARQRVDFHLHVAQVESTINVEANMPLIQAESSDRGQTVAAEQIGQLPLNGRYYSDLVLLSTGVMRAPSSYGASSSFREGSFIVNGLRSTTTNFVLDGIDNNYSGTSNQGFANQVVQPPPDAIAEFRVMTNNQPAEYGHSGGATIVASMRNGTNQFHGSAWEFLRNTDLNSYGYFRAATGKPSLNRNQFGGTLGGPIWKNKTFFFLDYEGYREKSSTVQSTTLPNANQRIGMFGSSVPIKNPYTGALHLDGTVPTADIIRFASGVMAALPLNTSTSGANNYTSLYPITDNRDKGDLRIDHYFSSRLRAFGRYDQSAFNVFDPGLIPGIAGGNGNGTQIVPIKAGVVGITWTISERTLIDAGFGYSYSQAGKAPPLAGGASMLSMFGITGLPTDPAYTGGISSETFISFAALGRQATSPQFQHPKQFDPKVNITHTMGSHTFKAGYEYQWLGVRTLDVNPILGRDVYSSLFTAPAVGTLLPDGSKVTAAQISANQAYYSLADFLYGARSQYQLVNPGYVHHRQQANFLYVQDDYKVNKNLTLNLGLRYDLVTPFYERDNLLSNYDPTANAMILAKSGSIYNRALVNMDNSDFAPRLGAAWSVSPKTVLHGGFSMNYIHFNRTGTSYLAYNGPRFVLATVTQSDPTASTFLSTQQGFPANMTSSSSFNPRSSTVQYIPKDNPSGRVESYYASVQQELPWQWLLDIAYVGNSADNLIIINDINQARPNAVGENTNVELRRPNQTFSSIAATLPYGTSNYNGLQVRIEKRACNGFSFLNSFTWSKSLDIASQAFDNSGGNGTGVQDINNVHADYGISNYDYPFNNVTNMTYELPFGRGRRYLSSNSRLVDYALGGWSLTSIINMRSGEPFTLSYTPNSQQQVVPVLSVLGRNTYRPNVSGAILAPKASRTPLNYLNASNVTIPLYSAPFGNVGRNSTRGYAFYQADASISKSIPVIEKLHAMFRAEAFNLFNHSNFAAPDGNRSNSTFGRISSTYPSRQLQLSLKVQF